MTYHSRHSVHAIYPGQELFINYGPGFFPEDQQEAAGSESGASTAEEGYASGEDDEDDYEEDDSDGSLSL